MEWNDEHTTLICKKFIEQVRKRNMANTHFNNVGYNEVKDMFFECTGIMFRKIT